MDTPIQGNRPAISAAPAGAAKEPFSMQTVLVAARCWWKVAAPLGLLLAVAAGAAVFYFTKPTYTAQAWLILDPNRESMFEPVIREDPVKFIANQLELMRSPLITDSLAGNADVVSTPEIAIEPDPVQALNRKVKIRGLSKSDYFVIEFTSVDRKKAALVTNAVLDSYFAHQDRESSRRDADLLKLYEDQQTSKQAQLEDLHKRWRDMAMASSGIDPFAIKPTQQSVQVENPHAKLQAELLRIQLEHLTLTVQIKFLEAEAAKQAPIEPTAWEIDQLVQNHPDVLKQRTLVESLEAKASEYRERSANPAKNPTLQRFEADLKAAQDKLVTVQNELRPKLKEERVKAASSQREAELARCRLDLSSNELMQEMVQKELVGKIANQKQFREKSFDEELMRSEYEIQYKLLESIRSKIDLMRLEQQGQSRVEVFKRAAVPVHPDEAMPYKKVGMAAIAAFLLPFALAVGVEFLYRRVSSRDQIEFGGKIPVVGEVTALPRRMRRSSGGDDKPDRDLQLFEESIDGLRTYLSLVHSLQGMRVLAVTSSISREGKTSLAAQLAVSIASSTGEATLLIDGDFRSPDVHQIFGVDRGPGMVEVLRNESTLEDAIDTSFSSKLHLLTAGNLETSPHRLMGNGEFALLVEKLRSKYRHIVIDTPPILAASEALVMARTADAAILCVRRDFSRVGQVQEAYSRLQGTGVKTAGAVLNGIPSRQYASRYGSYYYTRTYGDKLTVTPQSAGV